MTVRKAALEGRADKADGVLDALRTSSVSTVSELADVTGFSRPTVTSILADLEERGLASQSDGENGVVGRPATVWSFAADAGIVVGADVLVTSMLVVVSTLAGELLEAKTFDIGALERGARVSEVCAAIGGLTGRWAPTRGPLRQVGISTTGVITGEGTIQHSDLVPQWAGLDLASELEAQLGVPAHIDNDINMAAMGEFSLKRQQGRIRPDGDLLLVQLTRGLNTGLVLGGRVHRGRQWNAGEISDVLDIGLNAGNEPDAEWIDAAALTIGSVAAAVDPDMIVITGPTQRSLRIIRQVVAKLMTRRAPDAPSLPAEVAELGWGASALGAIDWALTEATASLLGVERPRPVSVRNLQLITEELQRGPHTTMTTATQYGQPSQTLRVGVVGIGARSRLALNAELPDNYSVITAVCDPHHLAAERVSSRLHKNPADVTITSDVKGLLDAGIDVAFVTSPDDTHADITCQLLDAGIPVYLEKPLAITLDSATRILQVAYDTGTKLYVGHNMRHMNVVRTMRNLIRTGRIGEVKAIWCRHFVGNGGDFYFKDWHATQKHGTGLLLQKAAHDIDVMHWLADSHTIDVVAMGGLTVYDQIADRKDHSDELMGDWFSLKNWPPLSQRGLNPVIDVEDLSMMLMRMKSGIYASYEQCHYTPDYWRNYTVIGTEGRIENFGDGEGGIIKLWNKRTSYNPEGDENFPIIGDANGHGDADVLTVSEFLRFVRNGSHTDTSPLGAWYAVAAGIQATESLRNGSMPCQVPALPDQIITYFENNQTK